MVKVYTPSMKKHITITIGIIVLITLIITAFNFYQYKSTQPLEGSLNSERKSYMAQGSAKAIDVTRYYKIKHNLGYKPIVKLTFQDKRSPSKITMPYSYSVTNQDDGVTTEESLTYETTKDMVIIKQRLKYDGGSGRSIEQGSRTFEYRLSRPVFNY